MCSLDVYTWCYILSLQVQPSWKRSLRRSQQLHVDASIFSIGGHTKMCAEDQVGQRTICVRYPSQIVASELKDPI